MVTTFAGSATGSSGSSDGTGTAALFSGPDGLAIDGSGNLFVADFGNGSIREITPAGVVTTIAGNGNAGYVNATGTAARFYCPEGAQPDASGNLIVADYLNNAIRKITTAGVVSAFAGSNVNGNTGAYVDGVGTAAKFNNPTSVLFSLQNICKTFSVNSTKKPVKLLNPLIKRTSKSRAKYA